MKHKLILIGCGGTDFSGSEKISAEIRKSGGVLDSVILPDSDDYSAAYLNDILISYRPESICFNELPSGSELLLGGAETYGFDDGIFFDNFNLSCYGNSTVLLKNNDISVLICFNPAFDFSALPDEFRKTDVIISRNDYPENLKTENCRLFVVNAENSRGIIVQNELASYGANAVSTAGCGNILIRAENGYVSAGRTE